MVDPEAAERRLELLTAVNETAESEWEAWTSPTRPETLRDKYRRVMQACAATGDCPRQNVCWYAKRLVERRMWELYGRPKGLGREEFKIPHAQWYEEGKALGFTDPSIGRKGHHQGEDGIVPQRASRKQTARSPHAEANRRYIVAFNAAGDALHVVAEWMDKFPVEGNISKEHAETAVLVLEAFAKNVHDMASMRRVVPTNMQESFIAGMCVPYSINRAVFEYLANVKIDTLRAKAKGGDSWLTTAEINKYLQRAPRELQQSLEPAARFEAQVLGFHGQQCLKCHSWRLHGLATNPDMLECVKCGEVAPRLATIFCRSCHFRNGPDDEKCGHCGEALDNPYIAHNKGGGT